MKDLQAFGYVKYTYRMLESLYSDLHSKLEGLYKPIENLEERLTTSSTRLSKYQKSSLLQRYWTAIAVGIISALVTNLIWIKTF